MQRFFAAAIVSCLFLAVPQAQATEPEWDATLSSLQKQMLVNFPEESYGDLAARFLALDRALKSCWNARTDLDSRQSAAAVSRELQMNLNLAWTAFREPPEGLDPKERESYWKDSVKELFYLLDVQCDFYTKVTEKPESGVLPLNDEQKARILAGETRFRNARLNPYAPERRNVSNEGWSHWLQAVNTFGNFQGQDQDVIRFLTEHRHAKLTEWKVDKTPGLAALNLGENDLLRWDGSTSLRPFADLLVSHLTGVHSRQLVISVFGRANIEWIRQAKPMGSTTGLTVSTSDKPYENPMIEKWQAHQFSKTHDSINKVIAGERDLAFATRMPSESERRTILLRENTALVCTPFARDALVFIDHRANPVKGLTTDQLRDIFSGGVKQWSDVGGRPAPIELLVRNANSGSQELMKTLVMKGEMTKEVQYDIIPAMMGPFSRLEQNPNAIGYSVFYYEQYMAVNDFARTMAVDGVLPSAETIESGAYPLVYEAVLVHRKNPGEKIEKFVRWLLSDEGQRVVRESGYVPISKN